jgi:predicted Zn-dependent peptidase
LKNKNKDRLEFETTVLDNGITIYSRREENVPFVYVWFYVPVGHAHNTGNILLGSAHFLEHICCNSSLMFRERNSYNKFVGLNGGDFNAATYPMITGFDLTIPSNKFIYAFEGLVSHLFFPLINLDGIKNEAQIISSEREKENKWWPGKGQLEHYCMTNWKYDRLFSMRQIYGEDRDLTEMSIENLERLHTTYLDPRAYIIVGGNFDMEAMCKILSRFETKRHKLPVKFDPIRWEQRDYHEKSFSELNRFIYHLGGIMNESSPQLLIAVNFIGKLLVNTVNGVLFDWLRNDLGWSYNMGFTMRRGHLLCQPDWELWIPLRSNDQVEHVRNEVHNRIIKAISNSKLLAAEVKRILSSMLFWYQTMGDVMSEAHNMLIASQRIINESEVNEYLNRCLDINFLREIYEKFMSPSVTGEFLAFPKKKF